MTFPNSRVGSPVIEGELVIVHFIFSNWGADGPAADRAYAFDKKTGELVWWTCPASARPWTAPSPPPCSKLAMANASPTSPPAAVTSSA
jgi:hypothetical protein